MRTPITRRRATRHPRSLRSERTRPDRVRRTGTLPHRDRKRSRDRGQAARGSPPDREGRDARRGRVSRAPRASLEDVRARRPGPSPGRSAEWHRAARRRGPRGGRFERTNRTAAGQGGERPLEFGASSRARRRAAHAPFVPVVDCSGEPLEAARGVLAVARIAPAIEKLEGDLPPAIAGGGEGLHVRSLQHAERAQSDGCRHSPAEQGRKRSAHRSTSSGPLSTPLDAQ